MFKSSLHFYFEFHHSLAISFESFSVEEKLHWTFKLYDKDGSGEFDPEEMEDIFCKLCKIAEGVEVDQKRKEKLDEERALRQKYMERDRQMRDQKKKDEMSMFGGSAKEVTVFSERKKSVAMRKVAASVKFKKGATRKESRQDKKREEKKEEEVEPREPVDEGKVRVIQQVMAELNDRQKESRMHTAKQRARQLFDALDDDGNGFLTEEEFVQGCLSDKVFVKVLEDFSGEFIWGTG